MAPEYKDQNLFSMKSDVFSFGVLLLEIINYKWSKEQSRGASHNYCKKYLNLIVLSSSCYFQLKKMLLLITGMEGLARGKHCKFGRSRVKGWFEISRTIEGCIHIGLLCVQPRSDKRPSINQIVTMFSSPSTILQQPSNAGFSSQTSTEYHSVHPVN